MLGVMLVVIGGGAAAYLHWPAGAGLTARLSRSESETARLSETPPAITSARQEPAAAAAQPTAPASPKPPTFDIVRVTPQGNAVMAGRAEPFSHVIVRDGDRVLGQAQADRNGEFVIVPDGRVSPGGRELTLSAQGADGHELQGQDSVVVMVGPPAPSQAGDAKPATAADGPAVAVLLPHDDAAPRVLQGPAKPQGLALNSVDYDQQGDIRFSGSAKPSAPVRVYVDNKPVGEASTDHSGQWTLTPEGAMPPGVHQLRVDEMAGSGQVQHRVELPFQRTAAPVSGLSPGQTVVQPGNNLWRIARQTYGAGARYTVIYLANREQIRDPNRIYPGQIFSMPDDQSVQLR